MSTDWLYRCMSHDPPMRSSSDETDNASKTELENTLMHREAISTLSDWFWANFQYDLPRHVRWLHNHPNCAVELVSEYDEVQARVEAPS